MVDIRTLVKIKRTKVYAAGNMLEEKVRQLSMQFEISRKVKILQSGLVQVPMVLGHFKPLILVPLGLVNGLSMEEVDAILSHELAHVKRRDYLVNLMQSVVEILFFFNPAVLWVSNMIKTERENCCDDLAISGNRTKIDYIRALVSCQEFANAVPAYAMAVNGGKKTLVNRVQRLISSQNQSLNKMEKALVGLALVSAVILTSAFSGKLAFKKVIADQLNNAGQVSQQALQTGISTAVISDQDTAARKKTAIQLKEAKWKEEQAIQEKAALKEETVQKAWNETGKDGSLGSAVYDQLVKDKLINPSTDVSFKLDKDVLLINGVKQPDAIHALYKKRYLSSGNHVITYRMAKDNKETSTAGQQTAVENENIQENIKQEIAVARKANVAAQAQSAAVAVKAKEAQRAAIAAHADAVRDGADIARSDAQRAQAAVAGDVKRAQAAAIADSKRAQVAAIADAKAAHAAARATSVASHEEARKAQADARKTQADVQKAAAEAQKAAIAGKKGNDMTSDLIAEGLIRDKKNFTYKLNIDELEIDGEVQSEALHRKYVRKYLKDRNQRIQTRVKTD